MTFKMPAEGFARLISLSLVQLEFTVDRIELRWLYQFAMRHAHGMQGAIQLVLPEGQEAAKLGKLWEQIVVLPDIGLQQPAMVGPPIQDVRGRQAVTKSLFAKIFRNHRTTVSDSKIAFQRSCKLPTAPAAEPPA